MSLWVTPDFLTPSLFLPFLHPKYLFKLKYFINYQLSPILISNPIPQGLYVRYRDLSSASQKYSILTIKNNAAETYDVTNLKKYTKYEFFLTPFYKNVEGQPSNSKIVHTLEDGNFLVPGLPQKMKIS